MRAKRQLRAKQYLEDRHVYGVMYNPVTDKCSHCVVKAKVMPSIPTQDKKSNPDHDVWILLSKVTGNVHSAHCSCVAGEGESCSHVGALLYTIEDISQKSRDGTLSSTSNPCKWNNPRKRKLSPMKAQDIRNFNRPAVSSGSLFQSPSNPETRVNVQRFRHNLMANASKAGWLAFFPKPPSSIPTLHHIQFNYKDSLNLTSKLVTEKMKEVFCNMKVSDEDVVMIEKLTRGQANNSLWAEARSQRITSSNFGKIFKMKPSTKPDSLLKTILNYETFDNQFVKWGRDHEPAARRSYANHAVKSHDQFCVAQSGLIINPLHPHLGASPDGLVSCSCCGEGVLEIKCPASKNWKFKTPFECGSDPSFFCKIDDQGKLSLKSNHSYYFQILGQMAASGRSYGDFVVWTLKGITVERIKFDNVLWNDVVLKLNSFYIHSFLPELFSSRIKRGLQLYNDK